MPYFPPLWRAQPEPCRRGIRGSQSSNSNRPAGSNEICSDIGHRSGSGSCAKLVSLCGRGGSLWFRPNSEMLAGFSYRESTLSSQRLRIRKSRQVPPWSRRRACFRLISTIYPSHCRAAVPVDRSGLLVNEFRADRSSPHVDNLAAFETNQGLCLLTDSNPVKLTRLGQLDGQVSDGDAVPHTKKRIRPVSSGAAF